MALHSALRRYIPHLIHCPLMRRVQDAGLVAVKVVSDQGWVILIFFLVEIKFECFIISHARWSDV